MVYYIVGTLKAAGRLIDMGNYIKLVNFELNRVSKIYAALMLVVIITQLTGVFFLSKSYMKNADNMIYRNGLSEGTFIEQSGTMSFINVTQTAWIQIPILLSIAALLVYVFIIWYRDWFGKNTFIYRLLMLPTVRLNIFFAKATTILLMVLGLVSLQLALLPVENMIIQSVVPAIFRTDMNFSEILGTFNYLVILFPPAFTDFAIHYLTGLLAVLVLFTAILFERSFGVKGIAFGVIYIAVVQFLMLSPVIITIILDRTFLYPIEYFMLEIFLGLIAIGLSIGTSCFLLTRKVTV